MGCVEAVTESEMLRMGELSEGCVADVTDSEMGELSEWRCGRCDGLCNGENVGN